MIHWDWTINIGSVCSILMVFGAIINYGRKVVRYMRGISIRVNVMWNQFAKDHPELARNVETSIEAQVESV